MTNKSVLLRSIGGVFQLSPYSNYVISNIRDVSVGLSKASVQMLTFNQIEMYSNLGNCFKEKLKFKDSKKIFCY
jgi:hypothetical protein